MYVLQLYLGILAIYCHFLYERILTNKVVIYLCAKALFQTNVKSRFKTNIANAHCTSKIYYKLRSVYLGTVWKNMNFTLTWKISYEYFTIFLSFIFYVKSILENQKSLKLLFFVIFGPLNPVTLVNCILKMCTNS